MGSPSAATTMPASKVANATNCQAEGTSANRNPARIAEPTGSPRMDSATKVGDRRRSAQLNEVCPISCGPSASPTSIHQPKAGYGQRGTPASSATITSTSAAAP